MVPGWQEQAKGIPRERGAAAERGGIRQSRFLGAGWTWLGHCRLIWMMRYRFGSGRVDSLFLWTERYGKTLFFHGVFLFQNV